MNSHQNQSPIPQEKLCFLNTLLDKELDMLKQNNQPSFLQKTQPSSYFESDSIQQSSIRALSNNPTSQKRTTTNDLTEIQDKIGNIEARIQKNIEKEKSIQLNQLIQQSEGKDSDEEIPLKNKYNHTSSNKKQIKFTDQEQSTKTLAKSIHEERKNKFQLEKNIECAENKLSQSKVQRKSLSQAKSKSKEKLQNNISQQRGNSSQNHSDVQALQLKVSQLRKQWEDDRSQLIKEKQKNQQMQQQIDSLNKKLKKAVQQNEKYVQMESEHQRLQENFEKSEFIRQQQKQLIQTLKQEIDELKQNKQQGDQKSRSKKRGLEDNSSKYLNK